MTATASAGVTWVAWLVCSLSGAVLIALPDSDRRLFSISETHGPAATDLVGALLLTTGWALLDVQIWRGRRHLLARPEAVLPMIVAGLSGAVLITWSVSRDEGTWWLLGATLLAGAQLAAAAVATARPENPRSSSR